MKMLFMYHDRPNYFGGPIINARRLLPELSRRGHEIHCIILYGGNAAPSLEYLENNGITCYLRTLANYTEVHVQWILSLAAELNPDIFVPNIFVSGWLAGRWAREAGIPTIATMRSNDLFHWTMVEKFVLGDKEWAVSGLACVAKDLYLDVEKRCPKHTKLCVIPSGVPVVENSSLQEGPLKLVYVGRFVQEQKRILDTIDALALIMRDHADITATLIGEGDQLPKVNHRIKKLGLTARIKVMGTVPSEEIQEVLTNYDVLVLLSDYEGTPGAVMDGMAAGLIPVCLDIYGGVRELVIPGRTGFLVSDRKNDFAKAIEQLATNKALRRMLSQSAKAHIKANFSLESAASRWEGFSETLIRDAAKRIPINIPSTISLPPINPAFSREDQRQTSKYQRFATTVGRIAERLSLKG